MDWVQPVVKSWLSTIKKAVDCKKREFQNDADEAMRFFDSSNYDFMYKDARIWAETDLGEGMPDPSFRMSYNKVAEMVQLFGPFLYHRNPHRMITPAKLPDVPIELLGDPQDPMVAMQLQQLQQSQGQKMSRAGLTSTLMQFYLNYTPNELDLRGHSRQAIDEALVTGMGVLWPELYTPPGGGPRMVGSFFDSVRNLVIDPDMESLLNAKWIARRRVLPVYEVEKRFGLKKGTLKGNLESLNRQSQDEADPSYDYYRKRGDTCDLFTYWEVYSRMGFGHHLRSYSDRKVQKVLTDRLDKFGQYCFLAVSEDYEYPLNIPKAVCERGSEKEIFHRCQWPTPFWADPTNPWPFVDIAFHKRPRKVWPMSHVTPAMGEIKFLNWAFSFIADKIKNTSRDFLAILKSASEDLKTAVLSGKDLTLLEIESTSGTQRIQDIVQFLQHPEFNGDIWKVMEAMMMNLERRLGLNELMYGTSANQMRSASEAQIKGDQLRIRPDDMAECVESAMTLLARKEAIAAFWHLEGQDVGPIMGADRAFMWEQIISESELPTVVVEIDYRIEAGSIRKPNRNRDQENANNAVQQWGPVAMKHYEMTGDPGPLNDLAGLWKKAHDLDESKFVFQPPPPAPNPEEQKLQLEQQKMQAEMQMKQAELQIKALEGQMEMDLKREEHQQEMVLDAAEHEQEMEQDREKHLLEMMQAREEAQIKLSLAEKQAETSIETKKQESEASIDMKKKQAAAAAKAKPKGGSK